MSNNNNSKEISESLDFLNINVKNEIDEHQQYYIGLDCKELSEKYPPYFSNENKLHVMSLLDENYEYEGNIVFTRWETLLVPVIFKSVNIDDNESKTVIDMKEDVFQYEDYNTDEEYQWHVNFAHSKLFVAYHGKLLAQDELQVLEHPILGSIREKLNSSIEKKRGLLQKFMFSTISEEEIEEIYIQEQLKDSELNRNFSEYTVEEGNANPILIEGAERRLKLDTKEIYGNKFSLADKETITDAVEVLDKKSDLQLRSNIIAIEALRQNYGVYKVIHIQMLLATAYSGFRAAYLRTKAYSANKYKDDRSLKCRVNTGLWGCGAYGGNKVLMILIQMIAAKLAQVDFITFYTFDQDGTAAYNEAGEIFNLIDSELDNCNISTIIQLIQKKNFKFGESDGN